MSNHDSVTFNSNELPKGKVLGKRWRVVKKIGEGGCGAVYKVEDLNDKKKSYAALKAETNNSTFMVLKLEVTVLKRLHGRPHMPQLFFSGRKEKYSYMVMTLLGETLADLMRSDKKEMSISTQVRIGINLLYGIKQVHDIGFIHRDLKPGNVAVGIKDTLQARILHILDFGLARQFIVEDGTGTKMLRAPRTNCLFRGTPRYCSVNVHRRYEQGRHDDLWSLMYLLASARKPLPWAGLVDKDEIFAIKDKTDMNSLFENSPYEMVLICKELHPLNYFNRPDYAKIHELFLKVMADGKYKFGDEWDWEKEDFLQFFKFGTTHQKDLPELRACQSNILKAELGMNPSDCNIGNDTCFPPAPLNIVKGTYYEDSPFPNEEFGYNALGF